MSKSHHSQNDFHADDPRLTAYVLGELSDTERSAVDAWLATSPEGRAAVEEIRELTSSVFAALQHSPSESRDPSRKLESLLLSALGQGLDQDDRSSVDPAPKVLSCSPVPSEAGSRSGSGAFAIVLVASCLMLIVGASVVPLSSPQRSVALGIPSTDTYFDNSGNGSSLALAEGSPLHRGRWSFEAINKAEPRRALARIAGSDVAGGGAAATESKRMLGEKEALRRQVPIASGIQFDAQSDLPAEYEDNLERLVEQKKSEVAQQNGQFITLFGITPGTMAESQVQERIVGLPDQGKAFPSYGRSPVAGNGVILNKRPEVRFGKPPAVDKNGQPTAGGMPSHYYTTPNVSDFTLPQQNTANPPHISYSVDAQTTPHPVETGRSVVGTVAPELPSVNYLKDDVQMLSTAVIKEHVAKSEPAPAAANQQGGFHYGHHFMFVDDFGIVPEADGEARQAGRRAVPLAWRRVPLNWEDGHWKFPPTQPNGESYAPIVENEFLKVADAPLSTFGLDVDTGSYSNIRRFLYDHQLPPANAVRLEELVNSFDYDLAEPDDGQPLRLTLDAGRCPWEPKHQLARIALRAKDYNTEGRPPASLVFLIDSSGSMKDANKLPLVQTSLRLLVEQMEEQDQIAIVTYSNEARTVLDSTQANEKDKILHAIDSLRAHGSTNGQDGLALAYQVATTHLIEEGANRVLLCTDGDFNVGVSDDQGVFELIEEHRKTGVFLSVLGFGTGNLKDSKLEGVANRGNGHYIYVDRLEQARKVFLEQLTGTLFTVAKDVKLQVEFNPHRVESYRLLGYENRILANEDFANDKVDAGEIGAGHRVTALYEIVPKGALPEEPNLRYQAKAEKPEAAPVDQAHGDEWLFVKLRYKEPDAEESTLVEVPLKSNEDQQLTIDGQWAAAVSSFGLLLRDSQYKGNATWKTLVGNVRDLVKEESDEQRVEFLDLVLRAKGLDEKANGKSPAKLRELSAIDARMKARCEDRYQELLDKFSVPEDGDIYGEFHEFGYRSGEKYLPRDGRPDGYWVYVYPDWYVWGVKAE
ncbi:MAG: von Willebrand factor type A domain-containing protein [Planctomycetaceae bacterium]|nr:von Willebrand factor type A domain-containing protein [Planctomycetaceae bacterium]